ncbi:UvrD-helicase domain-containing protein [Prevotella disiens]|uniref:UvrD-helicase domain-containing protein n=1 Tax=Prevotella disiens TaxID=28130 RepID=UPI003369D291
MNHTTSPLTVYRASAGSGKTFTLAVEYISLLVKDPNNYRQILAVTFTNKATQEMKMRILSQLFGIAKGLKSSDAYLQQVKNKTGLNEATIKSNATTALTLLIHKYNEFRIHTIDAFFQQILRNLAHELGLTANLKVDLNNKDIEGKAVDQMIEELQEGQPVMKWISTYIDHNMEDDKGWNVITKIKTFGENIFKDYYKAHEKQLAEVLSNEKEFDAFEKSLRERRKQIQKEYNSKAEAIVSVIDNEGLANMVVANLYKFLVARMTKTLALEEYKDYVLNAINDPNMWVPKTKQKKCNYLEVVSSNDLSQKLSELVAFNKDNWCEFQSTKLLLKHLPELRLLHKIDEAVNDLNKEYNRFMLSNTQSLLKELISDSDTPFIFEKIGAQLKHIMIDEFQDTSTIQWQNFLSLLNNCMGQIDSHNLIVGDIKQSIYRWRQGDWSILNNIKQEFPNYQLDLQTLDYNYRSEKRIIDFNNAFMNAIVENTIQELNNDGINKSEIIGNVYQDVAQKTPKQNELGYIRVQLFPSDDSETDILEQLIKTIQDLFDKGYNGKNQSKIAILIRENKQLQKIVDTLYAADFGEEINIVSDEAFRLDASLAVNIIIKALHLLTHPEDVLARGELVKLYNQQVLKKETTDTELLVATPLDLEETEPEKRHKLSMEHQIEKLNEALPQQYVNRREQLLGMPIIDAVDSIFEIFELTKLEGQNSYICTLYDILNDFLQDNTADIDDFIKEWDNSLSSKTIQSDEIEGIRIITIHKSKGLEFDNVIIPFCDWTLENSNTIIWCETENKPEPYNKIPILPINFSKSTSIGTIFEDNYKEEHLQNTIDNLNLLYVAVTRAAKNLFITGKRMSKSKAQNKRNATTSSNRSEAIENVLEQISNELEGSNLDFPDKFNEPICFEYGALDHATTEKKAEEVDNPFLIRPEKHVVNIKTYPQKVSFRQSNKSKDFVNGEDIDPTDAARYIKNGNILHQIFSTIYTQKDIPSKLNELEQEGIIYNDEITTTQLREKIDAALKNNTVQDWFSDKWKLFNECTILQYDSELDEVREHRPDRVMTNDNETIVVDFKTGIVRKEHKMQVERYMNLLKQMGHENVSGYLWYIMQDKIVEVTL